MYHTMIWRNMLKNRIISYPVQLHVNFYLYSFYLTVGEMKEFASYPCQLFFLLDKFLSILHLKHIYFGNLRALVEFQNSIRNLIIAFQLFVP